MILHIHSDCTYTKNGILSLIDNVFSDSGTKEIVHVFDLMRNSHPLHLLDKINYVLETHLELIRKIIVICDEDTAVFLRAYNIMCVTQLDSVMTWVAILRKVKERKVQDVANVRRLDKYYRRKQFSAFDLFVLDCLDRGLTFSEISELAGVPPKTLYSRYSHLKNNFKLNKCSFQLVYKYIKGVAESNMHLKHDIVYP